jgi:lipoprotein-anchoring transpeptidase ErfK/SrfK
MAGRSRSVTVLATILVAFSAHASPARITSSRANIRLLPDEGAPIIGWVERGDSVEVAEDGAPPEGWTLLRPFGAIRTRLVVPGTPADDEGQAEYIYGRVIVPSADVRTRPSPDAPVVARQARRHILAFKGSGDGTPGWLERLDGTFVARGNVKLVVASDYQGVMNPPAALAFVLRRVRAHTGDPASPEIVLERYTVLQVISVGRTVETDRGEVPRSAVRLVRTRGRPSQIGAETRWVHVDTTEQVLTAYEGDRLVFATLVSTGGSGWPTPLGRFRVWLKLRHGRMHHRNDYLVEEVPDALFFGGGTALHAAFWHDRFGTAVTHGCVNLSPADARWLFQWAPPALPEGWHGILPGAAGLESLQVVVEAGDGKSSS